MAPENTLAALKLTAKQGVGWVEFDVKITSDNITILFLDDTLMWTSNGFENVSQLTYYDILGLMRGYGAKNAIDTNQFQPYSKLLI